MKTLLISILFSFVTVFVFGQSTEIRPGVVLPIMTTAQRTTLSTPVNGMLVFDSNTQSYWFMQSGAWVELPKGGSTSNYWELNGMGGNVIKNTNSGGFWSSNPIGLTAIATNVSNPPTAPISGDGTRLMWIPSRSAFRVGTIDDGSKAWDADSVGIFSFASGFSAKAKGYSSTAMGFRTTASNLYSTAMGSRTTASGWYSTTMGRMTTASGNSSTAMGESTTASGANSMSMGANTTASGSFTTATGNNTTASGNYSTAMGTYTTASGNYSTAMGNSVSTNGKEGSFFIGDSYNGSTLLNALVNNRFYARFRNGYQLYTSANNSTFALLPAGASAWNTSSDSTRKENFIPANNEAVLGSIAQIRIGTWNYKEQDPATQRHWGIMAQDFHKHFGKDTYGTIGNDTTISTADFDGVAFAAIKGLEERTRNLSEQLIVNSEQLSEQLKTKSGRRCGEKLEGENAALKRELDSMRVEFSKLKEKEEENSKRLTALSKTLELLVSENKIANN